MLLGCTAFVRYTYLMLANSDCCHSEGKAHRPHKEQLHVRTSCMLGPAASACNVAEVGVVNRKEKILKTLKQSWQIEWGLLLEVEGRVEVEASNSRNKKKKIMLRLTPCLMIKLVIRLKRVRNLWTEKEFIKARFRLWKCFGESNRNWYVWKKSTILQCI